MSFDPQTRTDWGTKFVPNPKLIPPSDADAERAVLSACLNAQSCLDECLDLIRKEHFYVPAHQEIWEAMLFVHLEGSPVDIITVKNRLSTTGRLALADGSPYLAQVIDATPSVSNVRTYAQKVVDLARLRAGIAMCQTMACEGYQAAAEVEPYLQKLEAEAIGLNQLDKSDEGEWMRTLVPNAYRLAEAVAAGDMPPGLATGYAAYDDLTGGFHDGDLIIVAARPGMGKTRLMLGMARVHSRSWSGGGLLGGDAERAAHAAAHRLGGRSRPQQDPQRQGPHGYGLDQDRDGRGQAGEAANLHRRRRRPQRARHPVARHAAAQPAREAGDRSSWRS